MTTKTQLKIKKEYPFSKIGINEVQGLKAAMKSVIEPVRAAIKENIYWSDVELIESEYISRDGFIPHSHNCGGFEITEVIPECEQYEFGYLEFGSWDGEHYCDGSDKDNCECSSDSDGHYDAKLRVWFKFEGIDEDSHELKFYLYLGGGNGDAPYFRTQYEATVFETEFTCKSIKGLSRASSKHIKKLLKIINKGWGRT